MALQYLNNQIVLAVLSNMRQCQCHNQIYEIKPSSQIMVPSNLIYFLNDCVIFQTEQVGTFVYASLDQFFINSFYY